MHNHYTNHVDLDELTRKITQILKLEHQIMTKLTDIEVKFQELTDAIAEERAQANAKLTELQASIDELKLNLEEGGTDAERTALMDKISTQIIEVKAIIPDAVPPTEG